MGTHGHADYGQRGLGGNHARQVGSAAWSTQSTLLVSVKETDGKDEALIEESCRILTQYEELRFSRIQIEPPASSQVPVRWRQCQ